MSNSYPSKGPGRVGLFSIALTAMLLAGCGGGEEPAAAPAGQTAAPAATQAGAPAAAQPSNPTASVAPTQRSSATKWIGGIPYDVFYDNPLEVASDQTLLSNAAAAPAAPSVGTPPPATIETPMPTPAPSPGAATPPPASSGGGIDWAAVAPMEQLEEAITSIRNELQNKLNTLATTTASGRPSASTPPPWPPWSA